ncbi:hypothetical protein [uncultured Draconibacterium sp.]|uniref:hypothetical protein n=1 Tax=uncultured Draconibacterium sp. TaxID=1573823 RepID=UPI0025E884F7|nr:hypothetical protein [uncultured Draconibacterium sp.]
MCKTILLSGMLFLFCVFSHHNKYKNVLPHTSAGNLKIAPQLSVERPDYPSPVISTNNREYVLVKTKDERYTWFDATVENGASFNYKKGLYGKGNQLLADENDFPHFAKYGIHAVKELRNTKIITGLSVAKITVDARPLGASGVGFVAPDETILSVIYGDNETVNNMQLSHCDMARPLFHFWNIMHDFDKLFNADESPAKPEPVALIYNGLKIEFKVHGSRGWQESVFNDEILGTGHLELWRETTSEEKEFLKKHYANLNQEELNVLEQKLKYLHTGEMVFFYINRYGFYEGHTEYRVDPVTVAFLFGLKSIEELHRLANGDLYAYFTTHFIENPE